MIKSYKNLIVWQKGIILVGELYKITTTFPRSEVFGLSSQIWRVGVLVPSNISEGSARYGSKELAQYLRITFESLAELRTQLIISINLQYLSEKVYNSIIGKINELQKMIYSMIAKISK